MDTTPALEIRDVVIHRGVLRVVDTVSLTLPVGSYIGLIGLNGAGKSSLLAGLSGTLPIRSGTVTLLGQDVSRARSWERSAAGLALVPAGRQLFPTLSVRDNLLVGGHLRTPKQRAQSLTEVCELFPILRERLDQPARQLSGGQQQMVAIARALMADPQVLLLDEPSEGLAPVVVDQVYAAIGRLRETRSMSVLLAEQNASAMALCDEMYVMSSGSIGAPEKADTADVNDVARAMFGS